MAKSKKIKLIIPNPCTQDWNEMTWGEQSKFCSNCQKSVIDFSNYTDRELIDYFTNTKDKTCGRISTHQLNRLIIATEPADSPLFKRLLFGAALAAGVASTAHSQNNLQPVSTLPSYVDANGNPIKEKPAVSDSTFEIRGRVIDSAGKQALSFVTVVVKYDTLQVGGISTDANGKFQLSLTKDLLGKKLTIRTVYEGYHDGLMSFTFKKIPVKPVTIRMSEIPGYEASHFIMGDVAVEPPLKKGSVKPTK